MIASGGATVSRLRNGSLLQIFASALPNGSRQTRDGAQGATALDCIFSSDSRTYWVLDALTWNGFVVADCSAECRLSFWVQSKLSELPAVPGTVPFAAVPYAPCNLGEHHAALSGLPTMLASHLVTLDPTE